MDLGASFNRYRHGVVLSVGSPEYARICALSACRRIEVGISELFVSRFHRRDASAVAKVA